MSDDEYYGDYDDFDDAPWDTDPTPDLAEDLAEHALYSPIWHDDPVGELEPYYSDWEYYSDDYYDDDPILKQTTLDGGPPKTKTMTKPKVNTRGKKRKLDDLRADGMPEKGSLLDCIKGTVWAIDRRENMVAYQPGQQQSVALLKDWKNLFRSDNGISHTFGKGQLRRDKTWANDLSLADMGLLNEREQPEVQGSVPVDDDQQGEPESVEEEQDVDDLEIADMLAQHPEAAHLKSNGLDPSTIPTIQQFTELYAETEQSSKPRKRQKTVGLPTPPQSTVSSGTVASDRPADVLNPEKGRGRRLRPSSHVAKKIEDTSNVEGSPSDPSQNDQQPQPGGRKRKALPELQDSTMEDGASSRARAKRVASSRLGKEDKQANDNLPLTTRTTRSRKA